MQHTDQAATGGEHAYFGNPYANFPDELKNLAQWVCWRSIPAEPKPRKIPIDPKTGKEAKANDPSTWASYAEALERLSRDKSLSGIGFEFSHSDPYTGIDLDHCFYFDTGELLPVELGNDRRLDPLSIIRELDSYTELSPSGTGFHIIVKGILPEGGRKKLNFECYDQGRFFTVTGRHWDGSPLTVESRQAELEALHRKVFPRGNGQAKPESPRQPEPETDNELIEKACNARNGAEFRALFFHGDASRQGGDESAADLALCNLLAFWTNGDRARIDFLFRRSGLMREKWDKRRGEQTYGERTIAKALESFSEGYQGKRSGSDGQEKPAKKFHFTDTGNAERLVHHFGDRLRYCYRLKRWLCWSGSHWQIDEGAIVHRFAKATVKRIYKEAFETEDETQRKETARFAMRCEAKQKRQAMIELAQSEEGVPVSVDDLDKNLWLLNVQNGTLDLKTGKLLSHHPGHLITRVLDIPYVKAEAPLWEKFLHKITAENAELIGFLRRAIGYSLTGDTGEQCLFFMHGNGQNGKSVFIETLQSLLGAYAKKTRVETITAAKRNPSAPNNDIASLKGARVVVTSETQDGHRLNETLVKDMTGNDTLSARFLFSEFFEFKPEFKLWLFGNHKPVIRGTDHAIWRRIRLIPFSVTIPDSEKDPRLAEKLRSELPGILSWAVQGCLEWQRDGLHPPSVVTEATSTYRAEMDVLAAFFAECCVTGNNVKASAKALYQAYATWCDENGERSESQRSFGLRLSERGYERDRSSANGGYVWHGIGLLNELNDTEPNFGTSHEKKNQSELPEKKVQYRSEGSAVEDKEVF